MKHALHLISAALCANLLICLIGCSFFNPRLPDGTPVTQPTTMPLSPSQASQLASVIQTAAVATPPPYNAIIGALGSLFGLAASLYAQTKQLKVAPVGP